MKRYNLAVIGVGAVGREILRCLGQRNFPVGNLKVFARTSRDIQVDKEIFKVETITPENFQGIDIALFAGTEGEKGAGLQWAEAAVSSGAVVIDNGADFRLREDVPLIVPEVNREKISEHKGIIANPNCTTIQMVVSLSQIYKRFGLEQIILTSFQAVSGAGRTACKVLWEETKKIVEENKDLDYLSINKKIEGYQSEVFPSQIAFNVICQIGSFKEDDFTTEEIKTVKETHKIFDDDSIKITSTCVRVPVFTSHSEAIYFRTREKASLEEIKKALKESEGVVYEEDSEKFFSPVDCEGKDGVFVSRLRKDPFNENSFWIWSVSDNLRKGAALNAVQIAENLVSLL